MLAVTGLRSIPAASKHLLGAVLEKTQGPPLRQSPPPQLLAQCCAPASLKQRPEHCRGRSVSQVLLHCAAIASSPYPFCHQ